MSGLWHHSTNYDQLLLWFSKVYPSCGIMELLGLHLGIPLYHQVHVDYAHVHDSLGNRTSM